MDTAVLSSIFPEINTSEYSFCLQYNAYYLTSLNVTDEITSSFLWGKFPEPYLKEESNASYANW